VGITYQKKKTEDDIISFNEDKLHINNIIQHTKDIIPPFKIDICLPDYSTAIEYNGLIWHSENLEKKYYHLKKNRRIPKVMEIKCLHYLFVYYLYFQMPYLLYSIPF
jgi:hypothetical protein